MPSPAAENTLKLSVVIPVYNERMVIIPTVQKLATVLRREKMPFEIVVVNDNCTDGSDDLVRQEQKISPEVRLVNRTLPRGFGRAVRTGLENFTGDVVALVMADLSDDPEDVVRCYRLIEKGADCAYGSRFSKGGQVSNYPKIKLVVNRIVNRMLQILFVTKHNDLTNAFKVYRAAVIKGVQPLHACHFNVTIELSLSALIRGYQIAALPISWNGRTWGQSKLKLRSMGRRYLATLLKVWFERMLILDDLIEEKAARDSR